MPVEQAIQHRMYQTVQVADVDVSCFRPHAQPVLLSKALPGPVDFQNETVFV